jgi:hypothetical protein
LQVGLAQSGAFGATEFRDDVDGSQHFPEIGQRRERTPRIVRVELGREH